MLYPNNKQFALTIIDDTDGGQIDNIRPVYDYLLKAGIKTSKTVWALPSRDKFRGVSLENYRFRQFINKLQRDGFEIAYHGTGSGKFTRQDIIDGLEIFRKYQGQYPKIQINHAQNRDNLYWGIKRLNFLKLFWRFSKFSGDNPDSAYFWGDLAQKNIQYVRNFTFWGLNTLKYDPFMPYRDKNKPYVNFWFSSSDGRDVKKFNRLISGENIEKLIRQNGVAIIYTHFASGFVRNGILDRTFRQNIANLSRQNGWFVPASELLDYLLAQNKENEISSGALFKLELKWLWGKLIDKIRPIR